MKEYLDGPFYYRNYKNLHKPSMSVVIFFLEITNYDTVCFKP